MNDKPYDKRKNTNSLGSDLTTAIQNFHYSGEGIAKAEVEKIVSDSIDENIETNEDLELPNGKFKKKDFEL